MQYLLYVKEERTVKVELWPDGDRMCAWVATREDEHDMWGPPERCDEEIHDQSPAVVAHGPAPRMMEDERRSDE